MIKKTLISLSVVAAMSTTAFSASQDVNNKLNKMQKKLIAGIRNPKRKFYSEKISQKNTLKMVFLGKKDDRT